ncbi:phage terminase large subunit family protein [Pseudobythopirellula maris]|uniref:phage terminase large subunit family protein n=1 Tax=Pseudobythopirellula maris TaxID=2527991 RepID=UPI0011B726C4|nr:hypothetical protein [Pseudobythopirellula maris]
MRRPTARLARSLSAALPAAFAKAPPEDAAPDASEGLLRWGRRCLPDHFAKPPSAMHHWLAERLDRMTVERGVKVNLVGPRGAAKSTLATLGCVLRAALDASEPYIWIVSDTKSQAQAHLENVKTELLENERLARSYPRATARGSRWTAAGIELKNGVVIEAYGAGQRIRGRRQRAHRPTLIVCDDLQNDGHIASATLRQASHEWFHGALLKAGTERTNVVNLATALHRDALAMRLLAAPGWDSRLFKSLARWPAAAELWAEWEKIYCDHDRSDPAADARSFYHTRRREMDRGAEVLWPAEEDLYALMRMRVESGASAFDREKQGEPADPEKCEWPEAYFGDGCWFDEWPELLTLRTMALDPSKGSDSRQGDYSAIVMLGVDSQGVIHVDADLQRRPTPRMVADGVEWCRRFRPHAFGVEANQWQQLLAAEFVAEFHRVGEIGFAPCEIHNHVSKLVRIRRLGPYLSQRRLRFRRDSAGAKLLVEQLRDFPIASHDDGPDALEMALRLAEEVWRSRGDSVAIDEP